MNFKNEYVNTKTTRRTRRKGNSFLSFMFWITHFCCCMNSLQEEIGSKYWLGMNSEGYSSWSDQCKVIQLYSNSLQQSKPYLRVILHLHSEESVLYSMIRVPCIKNSTARTRYIFWNSTFWLAFWIQKWNEGSLL